MSDPTFEQMTSQEWADWNMKAMTECLGEDESTALTRRIDDLERIVANQSAALAVLADRRNWQQRRGECTWTGSQCGEKDPITLAADALREAKS